jgi:cellulose synthase (UDP-forming)
MQTFKPISEFCRKLFLLLPCLSLPAPTLLMLGILGAVGAISTAWFWGEPTIADFFARLNFWQEHPPNWIAVPDYSSQYFLLIPTVVSWLIAQVVMKLSPHHRAWSRLFIVSLLLTLTIRYVLWRSLATLNLTSPLNGIFSLGLLGMELVVIFSSSFQVYLVLRVKHRHREADRMSVAVIEGQYQPSVDILIPTYNEPIAILKRTVVGCQSLKYDNNKIYILDDSHRQDIYYLAKELKCEYITRSNNSDAKAGNLNHGISQSSGELIVVFDADFVPTENFLDRTVGFFQNEKIALLQTHQSFYNPDPVARNLGLENTITHEVEIFSRYYQLLRDSLETALCYGSSFVVRRSALEEVGGFVTESLSEDYFTGVNLSAQGYQVIYLDESLSAGLSAENMVSHVSQRLRWARGTLQAFFIKANPLTIPKLNLIQRLAHLEGLVQWFTSVFRVVFLLMPLAYLFLGIIPLRITLQEWLYFFLPFYLVQLSTFSWLNHHSRSALMSDIYAVSQCFPVALAVIQTMLNPFSEKFKVTPKGTSNNRFLFNWTLAFPLIVVFILTLISFGYSLSFSFNHNDVLMATETKDVAVMHLAWIWSAYNLLVIGIALLIMLDVPKPDIYEWFELHYPARLSSSDSLCWGTTSQLSEVGAEIEIDRNVDLPSSVTLEIMEARLKLQGKITHTHLSGKRPRIRIKFEQVSLPQYRQLVKLLFCRPGRWKRRQTPGELRSIALLIGVLFRSLGLLLNPGQVKQQLRIKLDAKVPRLPTSYRADKY